MDNFEETIRKQLKTSSETIGATAGQAELIAKMA